MAEWACPECGRVFGRERQSVDDALCGLLTETYDDALGER